MGDADDSVASAPSPHAYARRMTRAFGIVCEVEPATRPDLMHVRHQIGVMSKIASGFLIPESK